MIPRMLGLDKEAESLVQKLSSEHNKRKLDVEDIEEKIYKDVLYDNIASFVIVGSNGAGKSRLGEWLQSQEKVFRIPATKSLHFDKEIPLQQTEQAWEYLLEMVRQSSVTRVVNNYENILAMLFGLHNEGNEDWRQHVTNQKASVDETGKVAYSKIEPFKSKIETATSLWNKLFPHRPINVSKNKFIATAPNGETFSGGEMSDGERAAFYIMGAVLVAQEDSTIIIDEPENHIHKAILSRLFDELEEIRHDCCLVYITHDLQFASTRRSAARIWVKEYFGKNLWGWDEIPNNEEFPDELLFKVIGSRKPVLFVEGKSNSHDSAIYDMYYTDFTVLPVEGSMTVKHYTQAFRDHSSLHHSRISGIVDRDYLDDSKLDELKEKGIHSIECSEVENLFLLEGIVNAVGKHLNVQNLDSKVNNIKKDVLTELKKDKFNQIFNRARTILRDKLERFGPKKIENGKNYFAESFNEHIGAIDPEKEYQAIELRYNSIIESNDYSEALKVFNHKGLVGIAAKHLGLDSKMLIQHVKN